MKKKSGWIAFFVDTYGKIAIQGSGMYPEIYPIERLALKDTLGTEKIIAPQPVKIEWYIK